MKNKKNTKALFINLCRFPGVLLLVLLLANSIKAQNTLDNKTEAGIKKDKKLYFGLAMALGVGSGYPLQQDNVGISGMIECNLQKQNSLYSLGIRTIKQVEIIWAYSNVRNAVTSIDLTYGKSKRFGSFEASVGGGIALVKFVFQGKIISQGFWFSPNEHEKIVIHTPGIPLSAKIFWKPSFTGFGIEMFTNINSKKIFYGINFCIQPGRLKINR